MNGPKLYSFSSQFTLGLPIGKFSQDEVKNEPMFFNCTPEFAWEKGGPITRAFLDALSKSDEEGATVFDSRVHMLMPGWLPAIPGWHHDDVPRGGADNQPDYEAPAYRSRHALALVNGKVAPTEFAIGRHQLPKVSGTVYGKWHDLIEKQIDDGVLERVNVPSNVIVFFDWQTAHRAIPAVMSGWRWFGRASYDTNRKATNEIRRQVQVYLPVPTAGW